jgi:hypothetical protein
MPFKISTSPVWQWFRLAKYAEYSKNRTSHDSLTGISDHMAVAKALTPVYGVEHKLDLKTSHGSSLESLSDLNGEEYRTVCSN